MRDHLLITAYETYLTKLHPSVNVFLKKRLDWDAGGVDKDLIKIAEHMLNWREKLSGHLELTNVEINDILEREDAPALQRYRTVWA